MTSTYIVSIHKPQTTNENHHDHDHDHSHHPHPHPHPLTTPFVAPQAASGLSAVFWAAESVEKKGAGHIQAPAWLVASEVLLQLVEDVGVSHEKMVNKWDIYRRQSAGKI